MKAHDDLTFNVIGATMAYYDLTFNVIGATMESPSQNPLACLYKPRVCGNKGELLRWNPCCVWFSRSPRARVGGQQAHLSSGPLGFAEGSSTASLFLRSNPHRFTEKAWHFKISFQAIIHVGIFYYILLIVQSPTIVELVRANVSAICVSHYWLILGKAVSYGEGHHLE